MARLKVLLPSLLAAVLLFSLFFVSGSIAQPLGAGLLDYVGVSSGGSNGGTQAAVRSLDLPVTVMNPKTMPVPVTIQGNNNQPLSATINGSVDTNATVQGTVQTQDVNDPASQPFQQSIDMVFAAEAGGLNSEFLTVPSGKRLVIRLISANFVTFSDKQTLVAVTTISGGVQATYVVPETQVNEGVSATHVHTLEGWITADPGSTVKVSASFRGGDVVTISEASVAISGYYVDVPDAP